MAEQTSKHSLTTELDTARAQLAGYVGALRHDLDLGARVKAGVAGHPRVWFAGAAVLGLLISRIFGSRRKVVVKGPALRNDQVATAGKAAFGLTVLKLGFDFAKPLLLGWIRKMIVERAASKSRPQR